jgi:glycosyltransferase involved in cell wall biosynthesis
MKLSVITPTFNSELSIRRNIESVLLQSYRPIQHVIIDGGSHDGTVSIIKEVRDKYNQLGIELVLLSEKDAGIYDAFNKGINLANGDIIGILNSDDWWNADVAEVVMKSVGSKYDFYCGDINLYDSNILVKRRHSRLKLLWLGMYIMHPAVFVKPKVYESLLFTNDYKVAMDYDFLIRSKYVFKYKFKYVKGLLVNMSLGGNSSNVNLMREEELKIIRGKLPFALYVLVRLLKFFELHVLSFFVKNKG